MVILTRKQIKRRLERIEERLEFYYEKEKEILTKSGVASYTIGSRSVSRYQYSADIKRNIEELENQRDELENLLNGHRPRKAVAVLPRDW
jgi:hypothetical protein